MTWKSFIIGGLAVAASGLIGYAQTHLGGVTGLNPVYGALITAALGALLHALPQETALLGTAAKALTTSSQK